MQHVTRKRGDEAKDPVLNAEGAGAELVSDDLGFAAPEIQFLGMIGGR